MCTRTFLHAHITAHMWGSEDNFQGFPLTVSSRNQTWSSGLRSFYPLRPPVSPDISVSIPIFIHLQLCLHFSYF